MRALIIEDREVNTIVLRAMLEGSHFAVADACDGVDGMDAYSTGSYDILFVDLRMPRASGLDVIRSVRAMAGEKSLVPIVVVTADLTDEARDEALALGADAVVGKPLSVDVLFDGVVRAMRVAELRQSSDLDSAVGAVSPVS